MTTRFNLFVPATWLPALWEAIKRAGKALLKNLETAVQGVVENPPQITLPKIGMPQLPRIDLFAPVRWVWHAFWLLVGETLKALFLGFSSLVAVTAYGFGPFGCWSLIVAPIVLLFAAPIALVLWVMIWGGVLTCRFFSWIVRSITGNPVDKVAQRRLHKEHWDARNLIIVGCITLFIFPPFGILVGIMLIALGLFWGAYQQVRFWFPPKTRAS